LSALITPGTVISTKVSGARRRVAFINSAFVVKRTVGRFLGIPALLSPAWRRRGRPHLASG
jgi:hypothetical protein